MGCNSSSTLIAAVTEKHTVVTDWNRIVHRLRIAVRQKQNASKWAGLTERIQLRENEKRAVWEAFFPDTPYGGKVREEHVPWFQRIYVY